MSVTSATYDGCSHRHWDQAHSRLGHWHVREASEPVRAGGKHHRDAIPAHIFAVEPRRLSQRKRASLPGVLADELAGRGVLAQSWRSQPASDEPRRNLRPRVATRSKWARIETLLRNRAFVVAYMSAREQWRDGIPVMFPPGTYWLRRFAHVPVVET